MIRRFRLNRGNDVTGISGTGIVAEGAQFNDGTVVVRWVSHHPTTVIHRDVESVYAIHGHHGDTKIEWIDE